MNSEISLDILEHARAVLSEARVNWKKLNDELSLAIFDPAQDQVVAIARDIGEVLKQAGFKEVGEGRHRIAFLSPTKLNVVKVPLNEYGIADNQREQLYWKKYTLFQREKIKPARVRLKARDGNLDTSVEGEINLARCRMMGIFLVMEFVDSNIPIEERPDWSTYIDCGQVGRNRKGKIVAYDYA